MDCCSGTNRKQIQTISDSRKQIDLTPQETSEQKKMIFLKGDTFLMGSEDMDSNRNDLEGPIREETVNDFYIDPTPVTNLEFKQFIKATGYQTEAERFGWSFVFHLFLTDSKVKSLHQSSLHTPWWIVVEGADWAHPEGPHSTIENRMDHPVIHVSWNDANAYCEWSGKRLLTETEWEYAARGGLVQKRYPWGDQLMPNGKHLCNIWQGDFPYTNSKQDGHLGPCPVKAFPPNHYGLYSMTGNVWEWCSNSFSNTPDLPSNSVKAMRGGSYLCHASYCNRYRVAARTSNTSDSSTGNIGFRCAKSVE